MIGLSLSFCIGDILSGTVKENDVDYLIISCKYRNDQELDAIIDIYRNSLTIWNKASFSEIKSLIKRLDIRQPRLNNDKHCPNIALGYWVNSEEEIIWLYAPQTKKKNRKCLLKRVEIDSRAS